MSIVESSHDQNSSDTMSVTPVVINDNHTETDQCNRNSSTTIIHDSLSVNTYQLIAPTLPTERYSKHIKIADEELVKLKLRRKKNRAAARKSKAKRDNLAQKLEEQVLELEIKQTHLLSHIKNLDSYKQQLEIKYKQMNSHLTLYVYN